MSSVDSVEISPHHTKKVSLYITASNAATSGKTLIGLDVMMNDSSLNDVPSGSVVVENEIVVGNVSVVVVVSVGREVGI